MQSQNDQNLINYYESQKNQFESKASKLTDANQELKTDIQDLLAENQKAHKKIKSLEIENSLLKDGKNSYEKKSGILQAKFDSQYKELETLYQRNIVLEEVNQGTSKQVTILERDKLSLSRKAEALEENVSDLCEKNLQLSKLVDERIYQISGNIEKQEKI
jgi:predicted nuclease with TOPRIM domain